MNPVAPYRENVHTPWKVTWTRSINAVAQERSFPTEELARAFLDGLREASDHAVLNWSLSQGELAEGGATPAFRSGTPLTDAFRAWLKSATPAELQSFADTWNGYAAHLRTRREPEG